ncbi:MAG: T9SS type A sorting domain-containing protein [Bacteroidetes bacterium]|nr:T9SS type A sorting domain-containing protein [Bacteroidota bacterium]
MKKPIFSFIKTLLILLILSSSGLISGQELVDDPNLDQIPKWYLDQTQNMTRQPSEVITIDDYDNFYLGVDFAEGHISVNPQAPTQFFTAYNIDDSHYTMNGHDWVDSNPTWGTNMRGDPITAYDSLGNLYYENMYGSSILGCKVVKSTDNGQSWGSAVNAISGNDKNWMACDQTSGPNANNVYTVMTNSGSGNFARSTDQGQTWQNTFSPSTQSLPGMMVCVGADGDVPGGSVYVVTNSGSSFASTYTFYESNDGGLTFTYKSAQNFAGYVGRNIGGRNSVENMRTRPYPFITADNSTGPFRGRLYLVYASNDPPGDGNKPDIWSRYSDDGGTTWSIAKRVNSGFSPTLSHQWQPATWCDKETGRLYIQWMDSRDSQQNDSAMIYATYSDNGGETYQMNRKISNEKMKINCSSCGGGGTPRYQGDYSGIVSNSDISVPTWSDFRWGSFATFTAFFPDFGMRVYPTTKTISYRDTIWAVIPSVKLYTNEAIFSATIESPSSGTFTIDYPIGNSITSFPDSLPIVITVDQVPEGDYAISIKGEGPNGTPVHFRDATINVIPLGPPTADFTAIEPSPCLNYGVDFIDESIGATDWLWTFEGGDPATSTEQFPTGIVYSSIGSFDVSLEVTNPAGSDLITKPDYISVSPLSESPTGESVAVCKNSVIPPLVAEGENILWYNDPELTELVFTGNSFLTGDTDPGDYPYYATQNNNGCESEAITITLTIYETPVVTFMPLDTVCLSVEPFELVAGEPAGGSYFGDGVIEDFFDASLAGVGTHSLGYIYADENLCADTAYQNITVLQLDEVSLSALSSVCLDTEPTTLTGGMPEGGTYSGDGVIDNIFNPEVAGAGDHQITYTIISENGCPSPASQNITVFELPDVNIGNDTTICGSQTITLNATIPNASAYIWAPGGQTTSSITVDSIGIGYGSQEFSVVATDNNSCSNDDIVTVTFINCTGIEDIVGLEAVSLYPNPNDGTFNFRIESRGSINVDVKVFDVFGTKHFELNNIEIVGDYISRISLTEPKPGVYFISIENEEGSFIKKFLIK